MKKKSKKSEVVKLLPIEDVITALTKLDSKYIIEKKKFGYQVIYNTNQISPSRYKHKAEKNITLFTEDGIRYLLDITKAKTPINV